MAPHTSTARRQSSRRSSGERGPYRRRWSKLTAFYASIVVGFVLTIIVGTYQLNTMELNSGGGWVRRRETATRRPVAPVRFRPAELIRRLEEQGKRLELLRSERGVRVRPPRLALVVGSMNKDAQTLMLLTIVKGLKELGYIFTVYTLADGEAHASWEHVGCKVSVIRSESSSGVDWSYYEGVILSSLEAKRVIARFMEHPFDSVPLVWLIQEDILARRLPYYESMGWENLVSMWRNAFSRADVVVFPDFSLPMMYTPMDTRNFYVIPGSPVNVWEAENYTISHSLNQIRKEREFDDDDFIILVLGSYFFYGELPWEYAAIMKALVPDIKKSAWMRRTLKFVFLCGNSTGFHDSDFQELASRLEFPVDFVKHFGMDSDVNSVLSMADLVVYGSFQEEQSFPPLLMRAMSFHIPIVAPNLDIITKYVVDEVHGLIFQPHDLRTLVKAFSLLVEDKVLSKLAHTIAFSGKLLSKNMLALDCIADYATLLENLLQFPSDAKLPFSISEIKQNSWAWDVIDKENKETSTFMQYKNFQHNRTMQKRNIIDFLEEQSKPQVQDTIQLFNEFSTEDFPTLLDWNILAEMEILEDTERREREEIEERVPRDLGDWNIVYNNARRAEKNMKFENNERDEAELEKIGLQLCIYETYSGEGAWPFLHRGSLYRGISLSRSAQRPTSDDVDAIGRLPILNDAYYRDLLCESGVMFSIANKVDSIHTLPWIGFQSWHAAGREVSLSIHAEEVLKQTAQEKSGDVIYYWVIMNMDKNDEGEHERIDFWSMCDILNAGHCRIVFEDAFRLMYGLPNGTEALPPMPDDGDLWSTLHSWVMPTPSFLEFIMFSRMFVDSIDSLNQEISSRSNSCALGSSNLEKKHCYCRVMEVLVNVWAYHSARKMVYVDPISGEMSEQHPIEERKGQMWVKYFNSTLLKSMDEDLAEEADDGMHPTDRWLWPLTGEVHWPGIFDEEREDKYRRKMDKKRMNKEKLLDRQMFGYKQKSLG